MSKYNENTYFLLNLLHTPKTINQIEQAFAEKMFKRLGITHLPPIFDETGINMPMRHPNEGFWMRNWSYASPLEKIDLESLISTIIENHKTIDFSKRTTFIPQNAYMNIAPSSNSYLKPFIRGHEYRHLLAFEMPYSLLYIYIIGETGKRLSELEDKTNYAEIKKYLAIRAKNWLFLKDKNGITRYQYINDDLKRLNKLLDEEENEETLLFSDTSFEDELLDVYEKHIQSMNNFRIPR